MTQRTNRIAPTGRLGLQTVRGAWQRLSMALMFVMLTTATAWAWSGSGTESDPYQIATYNDLLTLRDNVNDGTHYYDVYFKQTANIVCPNNPWTLPIGKDSDHPFGGHYDGDSKAISRFRFSSSTCQYAGLFGFVLGEKINATSHKETTLKNIVLVDCNIQTTASDSQAAGIFAGTPNKPNTRIDNCRVSGTISGVSYASGIIRDNGSGIYVTNCFTDVTVSATNKGKIFADLIGNYINGHVSGNYYHDNGDGVGFSGNSITVEASVIAPVYTFNGMDFTPAATNVTITHGGKLYFLANTTTTLTPAANTAFKTFSVSGATSSSLAADKKSATVTLGSNDATVTATLQTIGGSCGDNATWSMAQDGSGDYTLLTISGTGAMTDYENDGAGICHTTAPWGYDLISVTVGNSITRIGEFAFCGCQSLATVTIGSHVTVIAKNAFNHCDAMTQITLPVVTTVGEGTFEDCTGLQRIDFGHNNAVTLGQANAFNAPSLQYIVFPSIAGVLANTATTGNWSGYAEKLRTALGSYLFGATNEGGTAAYAIADGDDLRRLAAVVNQDRQGCNNLTFRQTDDIDLTSGGNFTPIGFYNSNSDKQYFYGTYDGGDHTISGLTVNGDYANAGLFGYVSAGGTVKNVRLVGPTVSVTTSSTDNNVGALVGYLDCATIQNCSVLSPTVSAEGSNRKGAICGYAYSANNNYYCTLTNVYYYNSSLDAIGLHDGSSNSKVTRLDRVRKVTLGSGVTITDVSPDATAPENGFLYMNDCYYREGLTLTFPDNNIPEGYYRYSANGTVLIGNTYTVNGDVTLTATSDYTPIPYTITYNLNGGSLATDKNSYTIESSDIELDKPTRTGFFFGGWYTNSGLTGPAVTTIGHGSTGNKEFWAKWLCPYIDADGQLQIIDSYTELTGSESELGSEGATTWYVVSGNISHSGQIQCRGNVNIILTDDCKMTTKNWADGICGNRGETLTIYGQANGTGTLKASSTNSSFTISHGGDLVIRGGTINVTSTFRCIVVDGGVTISGGTVTITDCNFSGIKGGSVDISGGTVNINVGCEGILAYSVTITGGKVTSIGRSEGINAHTITLGWTNADDFIKVNEYYLTTSDSYVKIANGQAFYNGSEMLSGTIYDKNNGDPIGDLSKLDGKTLTPAVVLADNSDNTSAIATAATACTGGKTLAVQLSGHKLYKDGYWNTLTLPFAVSNFAGTPLEDATVKELLTTSNLNNGTLTLNFGDDLTAIEAGKPYIVKWATTDSNIENPVFTGVTIDDTKRNVTFTGGTFMGNYAPLEITDANRDDIVVLAGGNKLGYVTTDRTIANGKALGAFHAYFYIPGSTQAREFVLNTDDESTTGIVDNKRETITNNHWYSLDGRKLQGKPTQKGLYIVNGKVRVIK